MANEPMEMFVFRDRAGNYYAFPRQAFERARVPDEYKAELEKLVEPRGRDQLRELSDTDMEAVQGGLQSLGTIAAPSGFHIERAGSWGD
jgi:hypothetical protein